ncbi:uncharacterized protein N0V89_007881 [Didymosphaeria variabile]|uniref:Heterokaryon incompatibility domain-containing protein n=1 Tax=Didymosphaeria variabile TaxID=1932322 RepID=A0A9W8XKF3_9PLEO|nr:uncharacterized protein N0V89_007881 [Didymosphaeria variabile]KAJ4352532.1 hypothetical protein N0V89_007881 [Didymosphaeria variabile]
MIRLLHVRTKEFKEFHDLSSVPDYAILSHRWVHTLRNGKYRALELSFTEFSLGTGDDRGYAKIDKACEAVRDLSQNLRTVLDWIWIDSCCIDKNNNEEHSEAINSMYEWYAKSYVCIAYLDDADPFDEDNPSEWFKRGWTLQELIAPERVLFYNKDWIGCGSRNSYNPGTYDQHSFQDQSRAIASITRIDTALLKLEKRKDIKRRLNSIPACQKMSWASDRSTTKDEDMAYCLIGIFDIPHMYLKRGEGKRAFLRLQEEIIKQSNDLTLFAWKLSGDADDACMDDNCLSLGDMSENAPENAPFFDSSPTSGLHGIFACGPRHFRYASQIEPTQLAVYNDEVTITSRGVKLTTPLLGSGPFLPFKMPLYCTDGDSSNLLSIELRLLGGSIYARANCAQLPLIRKGAKVIPNQDDVYLAHNVHHFQDCAGQMHKHAIRLPESILDHLQRVHVSPGYLWSSKHNLVITNGRRFFVGYANYQSNRSSKTVVTLLFGLDHLQRPWFCLSNADESFEPHSLESRKLYLERVWRPASQHAQTAYLDDEKTFNINQMDPNGYLLGSMRANRQRYCDRDIFEVEFLHTWQSQNTTRMDAELNSKDSSSPAMVADTNTTDPVGLTHASPIFGPQTTSDEFEIYPSAGQSADYNDLFNPLFDPAIGVSYEFPVPSDSFSWEDVEWGVSDFDVRMPLSPPPPSANSGTIAYQPTGVTQQFPQPHMSPAGSPYTSIGLTPQVRPFPSIAHAGLQRSDAPRPHFAPVAGPAQIPHTQPSSGNHAPQDYQMQLMLLDQQNKKRLLMAKQERDGNDSHTPDQGQHEPQDYQMQLMLLEQQNKKRLLMARPEQDGNKSNTILQGQQMHLMILEQQNKKRLLMARQEQDANNGGTLSQGQHEPQQDQTKELESIAEVGEQSPSRSISESDPNHDLQDQPMRDVESSQDEAKENQGK